MTGAISGSPAPLYTSLPSGYAAPASTKAPPSSATADIVDIRVPLPVGGFTARAGDAFSVRELFGSPSADLVRVAIRGDGAGRLILRGADVTGTTDFEPMDFNELQFVAGAEGSVQDIVAVARKGTKGADGKWTGISDSEPVQVTALVTGTRSLDASHALRTAPGMGDADADAIDLVQDAAVFAAFGSRQAPTLTTAGNITLKAGDKVALHDLFSAGSKPPAALMRVALRDPGDGTGGKLLLNGEDATHRIDFTPEEFINLQFVAGPEGSSQDLVVVARAGTKGSDGSWTGIVDSPATIITAEATGLRSANAAPALRGELDPAAADAGYLRLARDAAVFAPMGSRTAPTLSGAGDLTVKAGDSLSLRDLFPLSGKTEAAMMRVALRDDPRGPSGGRLVLNGEDVTARTDFTPAEFLGLQYVAGPQGGAQDIMVVARAGTEVGGKLTAITDSPPALLRAEVTGTRSLNTAEALRTPVDPSAADADFMRVASQAVLYAPLKGQTAPGLATVGNFTAAAGDRFALQALFTSPYSAAAEATSYRVALRQEDTASGARLLLDGEDVTRRIDFTPAEYRSLQFVAGAAGSAQDLVVVARRTDASGMRIDSPALQVTARSTGERSLNALPALRDAPAEDAFARLARDASVYAPMGSRTAPTLAAAGDFTAAAGDLLSLATLFDTGGQLYDSGMRYRVAMRDDPSGTAGGRLMLNGEEVTGRTEFSGAEFASLLFQAGPEGSAQDLLVVARRTEAGSGVVTDSPATEITARATGTRSVNAMAALRSAGLGVSGFDRVVQDAAIYRASSAPALSTALRPATSSLSPTALAEAVGAYRATGAVPGSARGVDLTDLIGAAVGTKQASGTGAQLRPAAELVALLGAGAVGGVRTTGPDLTQLTTIALSARV
ncbi:hypothetical protein [Muricoccus pecuniae]|uniref:Uncharacterized protein n=1 Tax=Muricoccus pecuniae TaxID=693023 RepID=A0A840YEH8_9PROT|nr:hypothetical protein [Roseomonas pecuniae]MBB5692283.1 hypothetical protein [Roseomonas pecuniae]